MTYRDFVVNVLPLSKTDDRLDRIIELVKLDSNFPNTYNIKVLAKYLYQKLCPDLTLGFQRSLIIWKELTNPVMAADPLFMALVNEVVRLQNEDSMYQKSWGNSGRNFCEEEKKSPSHLWELSEAQYRKLVEMLFIAEYLLNGPFLNESPVIDHEAKALVQYVFRKFETFNAADLIETSCLDSDVYVCDPDDAIFHSRIQRSLTVFLAEQLAEELSLRDSALRGYRAQDLLLQESAWEFKVRRTRMYLDEFMKNRYENLFLHHRD